MVFTNILPLLEWAISWRQSLYFPRASINFLQEWWLTVHSILQTVLFMMNTYSFWTFGIVEDLTQRMLRCPNLTEILNSESIINFSNRIDSVYMFSQFYFGGIECVFLSPLGEHFSNILLNSESLPCTLFLCQFYYFCNHRSREKSTEKVFIWWLKQSAAQIAPTSYKILCILLFSSNIFETIY